MALEEFVFSRFSYKTGRAEKQINSRIDYDQHATLAEIHIKLNKKKGEQKKGNEPLCFSSF
ncbi:hypothetical protein [Bartonella apihabitans]|uniref:hypothetical protein n=1 Tax=Bartonella apihabitans TaxID=2750929 RepID=UPI003BB706A4